MAAPLVKGVQKFFDGLFLGPEVPTQGCQVSDWASALLGHQLLDGGVPDTGIRERHRIGVWRRVPMLAIHFGHGFTLTV